MAILACPAPAEEPDEFAVAPYGPGWSVITPDASAIVITEQSWSLERAGIAADGLNECRAMLVCFELREVA